MDEKMSAPRRGEEVGGGATANFDDVKQGEVAIPEDDPSTLPLITPSVSVRAIAVSM